MDHSVQSYLEKMSTEELKCFLIQCIERKFGNSYDYIIPYALHLLDQRMERVKRQSIV